jgi:undecaprenyl-diphosphatase
VRPARAALLGLAHGPLELLPVSSSAHVALLTRGAATKQLEVALHAGTLAALLPAWRPAPWQALAALPPAAAGAAFEHAIEARLGGPRSVAAGLVAGAALLAAADRAPRRRDGPPGARDALWLGLAQAAALVPGVSRHGTALAAARARGFTRPAAHRLSWDAGIPVLAGATALKALRVRRADVPALAAAALGSAVSTAAARRVVPREAPLAPFAAYRVALAAAVMLRR